MTGLATLWSQVTVYTLVNITSKRIPVILIGWTGREYALNEAAKQTPPTMVDTNILYS